MKLGMLYNAMKCWTEGYMVKICTVWAVCCILEAKGNRHLSGVRSKTWESYLQCGLNLDQGLGYL